MAKVDVNCRRSITIKHTSGLHISPVSISPSPWLSTGKRSKTVVPDSRSLFNQIEVPRLSRSGASVFQWNADEVMHRAEEVAQRCFGWSRIREFQSRAIAAWAAGRDSFIVAGTGQGKSACFQLPALVGWELARNDKAQRPLVLVISPLVALMREQVAKLRARGVSAVIFGGHAREEYPFAWQWAMQGDVAIAYMSPEFAVGHASELCQLPRVSMLAIDEAHSIFEWGQNFRCEYGELHKVLQALAYGAQHRGEGTTVPVMCLTATCTSDIRCRILATLHISDEAVIDILATANRPNLMYTVLELPDRACMQLHLLNMFAKPKCGVSKEEPAIVYVRRRAECEELAAVLIKNGISAAGYHGGMPDQIRAERQQSFQNNAIKVMVATTAFGMGIDKCDVRKVIHLGLPSSLEVYMQECGRAGRDGLASDCVALFTKRCRALRERIILNDVKAYPAVGQTLECAVSRLGRLEQYFRNRHQCRREQILRHVGEDPLMPLITNSQDTREGKEPGYCRTDSGGTVICDKCDVCCRSPSTCPDAFYDCRQELYTLLRVANACEPFKLSATMICSVVAGKCPEGSSRVPSKLPHFGLGQKFERSRADWAAILEAAIDNGFVKKKPVQTKAGARFLTLQVTDFGRSRGDRNRDETFRIELGRTSNVLCARSMRLAPAVKLRSSGRLHPVMLEKETSATRQLPVAGVGGGPVPETSSDASATETARESESRASGIGQSTPRPASEAKSLRDEIVRGLSCVADVPFLETILGLLRKHKLETYNAPLKLSEVHTTSENDEARADTGIARFPSPSLTSVKHARKLPWLREHDASGGKDSKVKRSRT